MKATVTKSFKLNMGNFESEEISATISVATEDLYPDDPDMQPIDPDEHAAELQAFAKKHVQAFLDAEIEEAAEMSQAKDSILPAPKPEAPARRTEKVQRRSNR